MFDAYSAIPTTVSRPSRQQISPVSDAASRSAAIEAASRRPPGRPRAVRILIGSAAATVLVLAGCGRQPQEQRAEPQAPAIGQQMTNEALSRRSTHDSVTGPADRSIPLHNPVGQPAALSSESDTASTATRMAESPPLQAGSSALQASPAATAPWKEYAKVHPGYHLPPQNREVYQSSMANPVIATASNPVSTFSIDVDTASYANVRRFLEAGQMPPADAVRTEELINYFSYLYRSPESAEQAFSVNTEIGPGWHPGRKLLHIGLQGYATPDDTRPPANLVFLVDVSGSMHSPDKLALLKSSLKLLLTKLNEHDRVGIVTYAGSAGIALTPTPGNQRSTISRALDALSAGGSTNGEGGIHAAYALADDNYIEGGINRVILATDGDFNVGVSNTDELITLIGKKARSGIALTTLGFGSGNYNDHLMEQLADKGNGNAAYIDTLSEANKVLSTEMLSTLMTIASDVKIQIEFNPAVVSEYRLIGYQNRLLAEEDFNNDKIDAGEIGAGHTVTALYEISLTGSDAEQLKPRRYSNPGPTDGSDTRTDEIAQLSLRYKLPGESSSRLVTHIVTTDEAATSMDETSDNYRFSAAVAGFGQWLGGDRADTGVAPQDILSLANTAIATDAHGYRAEFLKLVRLAEAIDRSGQDLTLRLP